jgi:hypothetical protein
MDEIHHFLGILDQAQSFPGAGLVRPGFPQPALQLRPGFPLSAAMMRPAGTGKRSWKGKELMEQGGS